MLDLYKAPPVQDPRGRRATEKNKVLQFDVKRNQKIVRRPSRANRGRWS